MEEERKDEVAEAVTSSNTQQEEERRGDDDMDPMAELQFKLDEAMQENARLQKDLATSQQSNNDLKDQNTQLKDQMHKKGDIPMEDKVSALMQTISDLEMKNARLEREVRSEQDSTASSGVKRTEDGKASQVEVMQLAKQVMELQRQLKIYQEGTEGEEIQRLQNETASLQSQLETQGKALAHMQELIQKYEGSDDPSASESESTPSPARPMKLKDKRKAAAARPEANDEPQSEPASISEDISQAEMLRQLREAQYAMQAWMHESQKGEATIKQLLKQVDEFEVEKRKIMGDVEVLTGLQKQVGLERRKEREAWERAMLQEREKHAIEMREVESEAEDVRQRMKAGDAGRLALEVARDEALARAAEQEALVGQVFQRAMTNEAQLNETIQGMVKAMQEREQQALAAISDWQKEVEEMKAANGTSSDEWANAVRELELLNEQRMEDYLVLQQKVTQIELEKSQVFAELQVMENRDQQFTSKSLEDTAEVERLLAERDELFNANMLLLDKEKTHIKAVENAKEQANTWKASFEELEVKRLQSESKIEELKLENERITKAEHLRYKHDIERLEKEKDILEKSLQQKIQQTAELVYKDVQPQIEQAKQMVHDARAVMAEKLAAKEKECQERLIRMEREYRIGSKVDTLPINTDVELQKQRLVVREEKIDALKVEVERLKAEKEEMMKLLLRDMELRREQVIEVPKQNVLKDPLKDPKVSIKTKEIVNSQWEAVNRMREEVERMEKAVTDAIDMPIVTHRAAGRTWAGPLTPVPNEPIARKRLEGAIQSGQEGFALPPLSQIPISVNQGVPVEWVYFKEMIINLGFIASTRTDFALGDTNRSNTINTEKLIKLCQRRNYPADVAKSLHRYFITLPNAAVGVGFWDFFAVKAYCHLSLMTMHDLGPWMTFITMKRPPEPVALEPKANAAMNKSNADGLDLSEIHLVH